MKTEQQYQFNGQKEFSEMSEAVSAVSRLSRKEMRDEKNKLWYKNATKNLQKLGSELASKPSVVTQDAVEEDPFETIRRISESRSKKEAQPKVVLVLDDTQSDREKAVAEFLMIREEVRSGEVRPTEDEAQAIVLKSVAKEAVTSAIVSRQTNRLGRFINSRAAGYVIAGIMTASTLFSALNPSRAEASQLNQRDRVESVDSSRQMGPSLSEVTLRDQTEWNFIDPITRKVEPDPASGEFIAYPYWKMAAVVAEWANIGKDSGPHFIPGDPNQEDQLRILMANDPKFDQRVRALLIEFKGLNPEVELDITDPEASIPTIDKEGNPIKYRMQGIVDRTRTANLDGRAIPSMASVVLNSEARTDNIVRAASIVTGVNADALPSYICESITSAATALEMAQNDPCYRDYLVSRGYDVDSLTIDNFLVTRYRDARDYEVRDRFGISATEFNSVFPQNTNLTTSYRTATNEIKPLPFPFQIVDGAQTNLTGVGRATVSTDELMVFVSQTQGNIQLFDGQIGKCVNPITGEVFDRTPLPVEVPATSTPTEVPATPTEVPATSTPTSAPFVELLRICENGQDIVRPRLVVEAMLKEARYPGSYQDIQQMEDYIKAINCPLPEAPRPIFVEAAKEQPVWICESLIYGTQYGREISIGELLERARLTGRIDTAIYSPADVARISNQLSSILCQVPVEVNQNLPLPDVVCWDIYGRVEIFDSAWNHRDLRNAAFFRYGIVEALNPFVDASYIAARIQAIRCVVPVQPSPTPTSTAFPTSTTVTSSPTWTVTSSPTSTPTSTATSTATETAVSTSTATKTSTATETVTTKPTDTATATSTSTSTATRTSTLTNTPTWTVTSTRTAAPSATPPTEQTPVTVTIGPSVTPDSTATRIPDSSVTTTATRTSTPTPTTVETTKPTDTATSTVTSTKTATPKPSATEAPEQTPVTVTIGPSVTTASTPTRIPAETGSPVTTTTATRTATRTNTPPTWTTTSNRTNTPTWTVTSTRTAAPSATAAPQQTGVTVTIGPSVTPGGVATRIPLH